MVEIPRIARPRPTPHLDPGLPAHALELRDLARGSTLAMKQRVPHAVLVKLGAYRLWSSGLKFLLRRDALARRGPHVGNVQVLRSVVLEVDRANAHARADVRDASRLGDVGEGSVTFVPI